MSRLTKFIIFSFIFVAFFSVSQNKVHAVTAANWQAGRITDDSVFYNNTSMDVNEVQNFLNQQVPVCDTWGTKKIGSQTRAQYGSARGYPPPYTCLKDYYEHPTTKVNKLGGKPIAPGSMSAAQIIKLAADSFQISPKALIVMLQKEQALVNDDWPADSKYRGAMGAGCPDTAPCDAEYYGFYNQVTTSARWLRKYTDNPNSYRYKPYQNNSILYNPNVNCGSSPVYIKSRATAVLYIYTPYQPNPPALENMYGLGDGCSAYGNRNYWRMYSDWFGDPAGAPFAWQVVANNIYDENKYTELDASKLRKGERIRISLKVKNIGTEIWYRDGANPIRLGTAEPYNHESPLCDRTWINCSRATKINEAVVPPGSEGHFEFYAMVPNNIGEVRDYLVPVLENRSWMNNNTGYHVYLKSNSDYSWGWNSYEVWGDQARTTRVDMNDLSKGQYMFITVRALNTSASVWKNTGSNPTNLGTFEPLNRRSTLCSYAWDSCDRPTHLSEATVFPGSVGSFTFLARAPYATGEYREFVKPVSEYKSWMSDDYNHIYMRVTR